MRTLIAFLNTAVMLALVACSSDTGTLTNDSSTTVPNDSEKPAYYVLDEDLTRLKADFNAMADKVRLVFISGPTCGICLRGLDDLNGSIVQSIQNDPRIHTLVVHVPTLGAEEKHVAPSIPLMEGPRVTHYWDQGGPSGIAFQKALDIPMYAWDVWMIYEPGARWEGESPPAPVFWQHQLGGLDRGARLDAGEFSAQVHARLDSLPPATEEYKVEALAQRDPGIIRVAQPRGVMIQQNHESRGGYATLKTIQSIQYTGSTEINGHRLALKLATRRPHHYHRVLSDGEGESITDWNGAVATRSGAALGLPVEIEDEILRSYDFDGWMTEFKSKGHQIWRLGMKKDGEKLPWLIEAELANGRTWHIYVDSHTGDAYRTALVDENGEEVLALQYSDYREVDGLRFPHQIQYFESQQLLATDRFERIDIERTSSDRPG